MAYVAFPLNLNYILLICCSLSIYPISIAAHPHKPNHFVVGLTDGSVYVFEPQKGGGDWIKKSH